MQQVCINFPIICITCVSANTCIPAVSGNTCSICVYANTCSAVRPSYNQFWSFGALKPHKHKSTPAEMQYSRFEYEGPTAAMNIQGELSCSEWSLQWSFGKVLLQVALVPFGGASSGALAGCLSSIWRRLVAVLFAARCLQWSFRSIAFVPFGGAQQLYFLQLLEVQMTRA